MLHLLPWLALLLAAAAAKEAKEASDPLQLAATDTDMVWLQGGGAYK